MHIQDKIGECATQFHHGIARHHGLTLERALLSDVNDLTDMHYSMQAECSINVRFPDRFGGILIGMCFRGFTKDPTTRPTPLDILSSGVSWPIRLLLQTIQSSFYFAICGRTALTVRRLAFAFRTRCKARCTVHTAVRSSDCVLRILVLSGCGQSSATRTTLPKSICDQKCVA